MVVEVDADESSGFEEEYERCLLKDIEEERVKNKRLAEEAREVSLNEAKDQFKKAQDRAALMHDEAIAVAETNYMGSKQYFALIQKRRKKEFIRESMLDLWGSATLGREGEMNSSPLKLCNLTKQ